MSIEPGAVRYDPVPMKQPLPLHFQLLSLRLFLQWAGVEHILIVMITHCYLWLTASFASYILSNSAHQDFYIPLVAVLTPDLTSCHTSCAHIFSMVVLIKGYIPFLWYLGTSGLQKKWFVAPGITDSRATGIILSVLGHQGFILIYLVTVLSL